MEPVNQAWAGQKPNGSRERPTQLELATVDISDPAFLAIFLTLFLGGVAWAEGTFTRS